jgi:hypothetical protein
MTQALYHPYPKMLYHKDGARHLGPLKRKATIIVESEADHLALGPEWGGLNEIVWPQEAEASDPSLNLDLSTSGDADSPADPPPPADVQVEKPKRKRKS